MPLQATSGAASYDAFGGGAAAVPNYIEDVFSTYLYTGNGSTQNIVNGINLSDAFGKGGLTWIKSRSAATNNFLFDTDRGTEGEINSNTTDNQASLANSLTSFNTDGFSLGSAAGINVNAATYASWTFRRQPKFFDIVYYSGTGSNRTIAHNLGSVPACIIIKSTDTVTNWAVYHRSLANTEYLVLNSTAAKATGATWWNSTTPTSSVFSVGTNSTVNASGSSYIAYVFAHDAGGFGLTGTDNVISCGSFTTDGSSSFTPVNLGYEPQWLMIKASSQTSNWVIVDNMRGLPVGADDARLLPNTSDAEATTFNQADISATGFGPPSGGSNPYGASQTYIYIAIRRGPMKVPTVGTSVFAPVAQAGNGGNDTITTGFTTDLVIGGSRTANPIQGFVDRLRGFSKALLPNNTSAEDTSPSGRDLTSFASNTGFTLGYPPFATSYNTNGNNIYWNFRRAPSFFDEVCYTGTGSATTVTHNLGVVPEMIIVKTRSDNANWAIYTSGTGATKSINFTTAAAGTYSVVWNDTAPTSSVFTVGTAGTTNNSGSTYVAYLFATCAGVSKVGSYTGTGTTKQIDCGFTGGARFVLIKRTDDTGDWYVWDSARGIVSGNDSYLLLNSTAAEVTNTDYIDTYSAGFEISSTAPAAINASGGSFIFFAVA